MLRGVRQYAIIPVPMTTRGVLCSLVLALLAAMQAHAQSPTPTGVWLHANKRIQIKVASCGERLCADIVWFRWPNDAQGVPLVDLNNPNPALRTRPLLGLTVLRNLRRTGENTWEDGEIYNPDDGTDYSAKMSIDADGDLRVRAYLLVPLIGHTLVWTRIR
jgi:uncharacterized protein (DUF2147 family)